MSEREFRTSVAAYAQQSPSDAKALLVDLMRVSQPEIRSQSLHMMQVLFGESVESMAIDALSDNDWLVRVTALDVLSRIRSTMAVGTVIQMLATDDDESVRSWAAYYLGVFGDSSAIPPLRQCVANDFGVDHEGTPISEIALRAIERITSRFGIV